MRDDTIWRNYVTSCWLTSLFGRVYSIEDCWPYCVVMCEIAICVPSAFHECCGEECNKKLGFLLRFCLTR